MDFIDGMPRSNRQNESIWVIVDRLTKSAHFIPLKSTRTAPVLAKLFIKNIVRLHGIPSSIVSDRDSLFTSKFWKSLQEILGTKLKISTAYHSQTDGQTERVNKVLEDLLRACVLDFGGSWEDLLHLVEFLYNNSYQASIRKAPFEALYERSCKSPVYWLEIGDRLVLGPDLVREAAEKIELIRARMKEAHSRQKSYADKRRKVLEFSVGDHVFINVSPMKGVIRFGKSGKLAPRFVRPFSIIKRIGKLAYRVELPNSLAGVHDIFYISHLRKCIRDPETAIASIVLTDLVVEPNLTIVRKPVRIVTRDEKRLRNKTVRLIKVQWSDDERDCTWETDSRIRDDYPDLFDGMFYLFD